MKPTYLKPAVFIIVILLYGSLTFFLNCGRPTGPEPFITIRLETNTDNSDSTVYTGMPIQITAVLDSAVFSDAIQWTSSSGRAKIVRAGTVYPGDTTSQDTVWVDWDELPPVSSKHKYSWEQDSLRKLGLLTPVDTIWARYKGAASNKVRVTVLNMAPHVDSIYVNSRKVDILKDSITIAGNHSTIAYIKLYASDHDSGSRLDAQWIQQDNIGRIIKIEKAEETSKSSYSKTWKWNILWQAPNVGDIGDSTVMSSSIIKVADRNGAFTRIPVRIIVYRESGSVWLASTQENTSTLIKYSDSGKELFRIPGFGQINCLAVSPRQEKVWFTDRTAGKVYCVDDDGNIVYEAKGFKEPKAIDVHDKEGYCIVTDEDTSTGISSRIRIVNKNGKGEIDSSAGIGHYLGNINFLKLDQQKLTDIWFLMQARQASDSIDFIYHYKAWWTFVSQIKINGELASLDINPITKEVWVADKGNNRVLRIDMKTNSITAVITGFLNPHMVAVNTADSSCWVVDTDHNRVVKLFSGVPDGYDVNPYIISSATDYHVSIDQPFGINFKQPVALTVNPHDGIYGVVWVVDTQNNRIVKLDGKLGDWLLSIEEFGMESSSFIAANTGTK